MSDFDDIKKQREKKEADEREKRALIAKESKDKYLLQQDSGRKQEEARQSQNEMVRSLLREFMASAYPSAKIEGWSIGNYEESWSDSNPDPVWKQIVTVSLKFDKQDVPTEFICWKQGASLSAGLSRDSLAATLKRLYSSVPQKRGFSDKEVEFNGAGCAKALWISLFVAIGTLPLVGLVGFGIGAFLFTAMTKSHNIFLGGLLFIGFYWALLWALIYFIFTRHDT